MVAGFERDTFGGSLKGERDYFVGDLRGLGFSLYACSFVPKSSDGFLLTDWGGFVYLCCPPLDVFFFVTLLSEGLWKA